MLTVSCGARLLKLPSEPGAPASDISQVFTEATRACRDVTSITAEVAVSGSVGGRRLRARLIAGLEAPSSARLEAFALGQQIFILVARDADATLLLTRENRILQRGRSQEILEAVAGIPLDTSELRTTLLGCPPISVDPSSGTARQVAEWRVLSSTSTDVYFRRTPSEGPWRLVAAVHRDRDQSEWRAEYHGFEANLPRTIRLVSSNSRRFDLRLALSEVELDAKLPAAAFEVKIPPTAEPITIEELRRNGPLASTSDGSGEQQGQSVPPDQPRRG